MPNLYCGLEERFILTYPVPMAHYLSFDFERNSIRDTQFTNYKLGSTTLLPKFFGPLAPVNIFLGENNSGKSRFMREIIKSAQSSVYDINFSFEEIKQSIDLLRNEINICPMLLPEKIQLSVYKAAERIDEIKNLLVFNENSGDKYILNIGPMTSLGAISSISFQIREKLSNNEAILDLLANKLDNKITRLRESVDNLSRAINICMTLNTGIWGQRIIKGKSNAAYSKHNIELELINLPNTNSFETDSGVIEFQKSIEKTLIPIVNSTNEILKLIQPLWAIEPTIKKRIYIPVLRTARKLTDNDGNRLINDKDILMTATQTDYKLNTYALEIKTGLSLYKDIDTMYKSRIELRGRLHAFEEFLANAFFNGKRVTVVPEQENGKDGGNILVTVDNEERDIHDLGDGIQAVIVLLFPLFMAENDTWFFIEEPETHLHPGFQRLFIKTISTNKDLINKGLFIFLTTHSNHILDFAIEEAKKINLFSFRKITDNESNTSYTIQLSRPRDLGNLIDLGVQNSSVFLSNCTVWVEGITDRIYLSAYLKCLLAQEKSTISLIDGLHYSFLEYAGSNVAHYTFNDQTFDDTITPEAIKKIKALSISNRIMLVADQDGGAKTKRDENLINEQHDGFEYRILEVREIENLLSPEIITNALHGLYPKDVFDPNMLDVEEYKNEYLGSYLRNKFPIIPENFAPSDGSGTIGSAKKRRFAEEAVKTLDSWDQLTPEAQKLTEQVFAFIMNHNPRLRTK